MVSYKEEEKSEKTKIAEEFYELLNKCETEEVKDTIHLKKDDSNPEQKSYFKKLEKSGKITSTGIKLNPQEEKKLPQNDQPYNIPMRYSMPWLYSKPLPDPRLLPFR